MDPALLREREAFKKRAMATPSIEHKPKVVFSAPTSSPREESKKKMRPLLAPRLDAMSYKTMAGSSQYRFGVLAKIVKHMRARHQEGDDHPLTIDEILDETNQLDVGQSTRNWLEGEALKNNPKIEVSQDGMHFNFKPVYKIKDGKSLMRLLKQQDLKGLGGIFYDDVQESLPQCDKILKKFASEIIFITRPGDKKKVLYYNDRTADIEIDEEFQKLWRAVAVDAMDDAKIEEYLEKQGISYMHDNGAKKPAIPKRKKINNKKRQFKKPRDNEHLADVLESYEDNTLTLKGENPVNNSNNK